jgi:hypothetical protein
MVVMLVMIMFIEQNAPHYQDECFITSPMEDGQGGDFQMDGVRT